MTEAQPHSPRHAPAEYYPWFDYLRIALAIGVFITHADYNLVLPSYTGNACVQIFFALSGFLIGGILVNAEPSSLPRFYFNRLTRIWIPYGIAVAVLMAGTLLRMRLDDPKLWEIAYYKATFVYNLFGTRQLAQHVLRMPLAGSGSHFWSICVEEQFYLFAPLLMIFLPRARAYVLLAVLAVHFAFTHNFASISLGVLLAISTHHYGPWYRKTAPTVALAGVLAAVCTLVAFRSTTYQLVVPFGSVATVALLARPGPALPLGAVLGGMSYPFYLEHWIGIFLRKTVMAVLHVGPITGSIASLIVALAISWVHYQFIDRQVMAHRSKWYTRARGVRSSVAGFSLVFVGVVVGLYFYFRPIP
jgi:peptidoglycan/LPS O-acetylase OafA/YrhL